MNNYLVRKYYNYPHKIWRNRHNICFTLIELLLVISIIAILSAILLPALQNAKITVNSSSCKSSQKQVNLLLQIYANDHDERFPGHYYGPLGAPFYPYYWYAHLASATDVSDKVMNQIYSCPGSRPKSNYTVVHGMNAGAMSAVNQSLRLGSRRVNCPEPSRTFLTQDGLMDASWLDHFRHNTFKNWGNVSFIDGHAAKFNINEYGIYDRSFGVTDGGYLNGKDWTAPLIVDYW